MGPMSRSAIRLSWWVPAVVILLAASCGPSTGESSEVEPTSGFVVVCRAIGEYGWSGDAEDPRPDCSDGTSPLVTRADFDRLTSELVVLADAVCDGNEPEGRLEELNAEAIEVGFPEFWPHSRIDGWLDARCPEWRTSDTTATTIVYGLPPTVQIRSGLDRFELSPFSYCWPDAEAALVCADGAADPGAVVIEATSVLVTADHPLLFIARVDDPCAVGSVEVDQHRDSEATITVSGPPGVRPVVLFGLGDDTGTDASFAFTLVGSPDDDTNSIRGEMTFLDPNNKAAGGTFSLSISGDAVQAETLLRLSIASDSPERFDVELASEHTGECTAGFSLSADAFADVEAVLGAPPYEYEIVIVSLDEAFAATATWPDDVPSNPEGILDLILVGVALPADPPPAEPEPLITAAMAEESAGEFLRLLSVAGYDAAAALAVQADWIPGETIDELVTAIDAGDIDGATYAEQLREWCEIASCVEPVSVEATRHEGITWSVTASWPDGSTSELEVFVLEGINISGLPPR